MLGRIEASDRRLRRFVADASHELRTPLAAVRAYAELFGRGAERRPDDLARSMSGISRESERMSLLVDDLLLLARLDEGLQLRREPVEVELVLREALLRALLVAPSNARVCAEPGLYALADPERLLQVLTNLLTNAITHTDERATIVLASERQGDHALIRVCDDGCGIRADELPHVFERFYRGARERAQAPEGSGLGLAIASSLLTAMNGAIEVESTPRCGTTFSIRLPLAGTDEDEHGWRATDARGGNRAASPARPVKAGR
jgi:two-component system OmpR family sensor kinase